MYEAVGPDGKRQHTVAETAEAVARARALGLLAPSPLPGKATRAG